MLKKEIMEKLKKDLNYRNALAAPRIIKVVVNVGTGQMKTNPQFGQAVEESLMAITGQKPAPRMARKAIAGFKIRQGEEVGKTVTLRGKKMADFIFKLANIVLPRLRDFRGLKLQGFDQQGNFTLGIPEQIIFPEISPEKSAILHGLSVSLHLRAKNRQEAKMLLEAWGFPFEKEKNG